MKRPCIEGWRPNQGMNRHAGSSEQEEEMSAEVTVEMLQALPMLGIATIQKRSCPSYLMTACSKPLPNPEASGTRYVGRGGEG